MQSKIDLSLTKSEIKDMFSSSVFKRGLVYYYENRIEDLTYDADEQVWHASVIGSESYDVEVSVKKNGMVVDHCSCPAHASYGECKHSVAVLLKLSESGSLEDSQTYFEEQQKRRSYETAKALINSFTNLRPREKTEQSLPTKEALTVEYYLKIHNSYSMQDKYFFTLELKVGPKRTYVVKKVGEFLEHYHEQKSYFFTNNFSFDPFEHKFTSTDEKLLEMLYDMYAQEQLYTRMSPNYWSKTSIIPNRELLIAPYSIDRLFSTFKETGTELFYSDAYGRKQRIEIHPYFELPYSIELLKGEENEFIVDLSHFQDLFFMEMYGYVFDEKNLYKLTNEQQTYMKELERFLTQEKLAISKEQIEQFVSHVVPKLNKLTTIQMDETLQDDLISVPLRSNVFIDYDLEKVTVKVEHHYGDITINPFERESRTAADVSERIIIRDVENEQRVMDVIESSFLKINGDQLYVEGDEEIYHFLFHSLPLFEQAADVFLTNSAKNLLGYEQYEPSTSIDIDSSGNWLEVSFNVEGIEQESVQAILQAVVEKKRFYRLPNGAFLSFEDKSFQQMDQIFKQLDIQGSELDKGKVEIPLYRSMQLENIIGEDQHYKAKYSKAFRRLLQNLKHPDELDFTFPENVKAELRDYQNFGYQWFKTLSSYRLGGILADDMGLGKTLQSITYLVSEKEEHPSEFPSLVVAPASLIYNWKSECQKFAPSLTVAVIDGAPEERKQKLEDLNGVDVCITSYPLMRQDSDLYAERTFDTLILDEAQAIKNPQTKTFKAITSIRAPKRFALSGTPIENSIDELWSIFYVLLPGFFPKKQEFSKLELEQISKMVKPFILRRLKTDVLKELPDKIETVQISELTKTQKELYVGYLQKVKQETSEILKTEGLNKGRIKILAALTRLRQLCCHPSLFLEKYDGGSGKMEQLLETVQTAIDNGKRILIFSQFSSMLKIIEERMKTEGYNYFYLDGQTPGKDRVDMAERFNQGENSLFLISLKAGGTGLNLTGADTVILYDLWWNPAIEEQAAGRAHRIGQKNVVQVIKMIAQGTIEEKIYEMQQSKKELIEKVIQPGETMLTSLTEQEILELLG
ncbi:DEAD/DEAH box helicase [Alkalihalobacterium chitinilyticum]|uniref:SNF2 helicase associated domain-containing protein n=1 Tax=Alkalihalobacterium chitinilyticum TaxID=2980103 RepID=A0ABT5VH51_9BACI|nr:SNF2 helicase associated domain-containing protein [Alkalihalobacterium chitinilyticum]MDE5414511.1 SNF2 helicase associated domain-containing protein [Alkalihalobacterium chitinilyticum]